MTKFAKRTAAAVGAVAVLLVIILLVFPWNWLRGPVARIVSHDTGRSFAINGDLDAHLGLRPRIEMAGLVLGNTPWGSDPVMARVDRLAFRIDLLKLLTGRAVFPEIDVERPQVLLERDAQGRNNWTFKKKPQPEKPARPPEIANLTVREGTARYIDQVLHADVTAHVSTHPPQGDERRPTIAVDASGTYLGDPFRLEGHGAAVLSAAELREPYPLVLHVRANKTEVDIEGTIQDPMDFEGLNLAMTIKGTDLANLNPLVPVALPTTPPYSLIGNLTRARRTWGFYHFTGKVGASDLEGDFAVDLAGKKPRMRGKLLSHRLDFADLGGLIGATPGHARKGNASEEQKRIAEERARSSRLLPTKAFSLEKLNAFDADVSFRGERIRAPDLPIQDLDTHLVLENGKLTLRPLDLGIAGGHVAGFLVMDARASPIHSDGDLTLRNLHLGMLVPKLEGGTTSAGTLGGRFRIKADGNSVAQLLGSADGEVAVIMSGGSVSDLILKLMNIDLANALAILLTRDERMHVRCMVGYFDAHKGDMKVRTLVMDTRDTNVTGEGHVDFHDEKLDLRLTAHAKTPSLVALHGPIDISGSFKHPDVHPEMGHIAAKTLAAVAMGTLLTPVAAFVPLVQIGGGQDADCRDLIAYAKNQAASPTIGATAKPPPAVKADKNAADGGKPPVRLF